MRNYTTTVGVEKTLAEIHRTLARAGARSVRTDYGPSGAPTAVTFLVATPLGDLAYALPANSDGVYAALQRQYANRRIDRRYATRDQAARVAWRVVKDWIAAQVAIIEAGMAPLDQIMLPFQLVEDGKTAYDAYRETRDALPSPP